MRRTDREITDTADILSIIDKCDVCRLGLSNNDMPYIVPLNYGHTYEDGVLTLYFHGAGEGKKLDMIKANPMACFEMDCAHKLVRGERAGSYTMRYESVIGSGKVHICTDTAEKAKALTALMAHYVPERAFTFTGGELAAVTVFKLVVAEFTGKRSKDPEPV